MRTLAQRLVGVGLVGAMALLLMAPVSPPPSRVEPIQIEQQGGGFWIAHISSALHVAGGYLAVTQSGIWTVQPGNTPNTAAWIVNANQGTAGNFPWPVAAHIQTGAVQQGAAGAQAWPVAAHQAGQSGGVWRLDHVTSVLHVSGNVRLTNVAGTAVTVTSTSLDVNCTGGCAGGTQTPVNQMGVWTIQALHQAVISHVSSVTHIGGTASLVSQAGTYVSVTGTALDASARQGAAGAERWPVSAHLIGNLAHVQSVMAHVIGTVTAEGRGAAGTPTGGVLSVQGVSGGTAAPVSQSGTWTVQPGNTPNTAAWLAQVQHVSAVLHVAAAVGTATIPCSQVANVNQTASATLITGTAGQRVAICGVVLVSDTAQNLSVVEGTGTNCATGVAGLLGGTTASMSMAANGGVSSIAGFPWLLTRTTGNNVCVLQSGTGNVSGGITYRLVP